jgi:class 3 adenylate cyclase
MTEGRTQTFLFADLAGFTALTEAHGDEEAAELASDFFDQVRQLLPDYQARRSRRSATRVGCVNSIALQIARLRGPTEFAHPTGLVSTSMLLRERQGDAVNGFPPARDLANPRGRSARLC